MWRHLLITLTALVVAFPLHGSWFSKAPKSTPDPEREQRLKTEQRLDDAQQQIESQRQTIQRLYAYSAYGAAGAVVSLIIGVAIGSKVRRDENPK